MSAGISFFMVSSSDLKYKLMRHVTFQPITFLDCSRTDFMYFLYERATKQNLLLEFL